MLDLLFIPSVLVLLAASLLYVIIGGIYRLFFSPIAHFPGPRLAALTYWYEFYYDVACQGRYSWKILELHEKYGPVIRINPEELHISDPDFHAHLYVSASRRHTEKFPFSARMFGTSTATVSTVSHDLHRLRRAPLNTFFSKRNVVKMEQSVGKQVKKVVQRLERMRGKIVNLRDLYACFSADVIGDVAFGAGYGLLDKEDFAPGWWRLMMDLSRATHLMKQFPWLYTLFTTLPERLVALVHPLTKQLFDIRNGLSTQIDVFRSTLCHSSQDVPKKDVPKKDVPKKDVEIFPHPTILHHLFSANTPLPPTELTTPRLTDESFTLLGAGTITTSHTLTTALYHILSDPTIESYLRTELVQLSPMPTWTELKRLPYLSAVIAEALRLSFGVSHRLARVSPDEPLYYPPPSEKGEPDTIRPQWVIPPGTPVSMTQMFIHLDPAIFPSPGTFDPSRWLEESPSPALTSSDDDESQSKRQRRIQYMHQHLIPFSRGSRMCAGMHLAYVELYLMLGALFSPGREWRLKLWETDKEDVETVRDFFNPDSGSNSKGVRVLVV